MACNLWTVGIRVGNLRYLHWVVCANSSSEAKEKAIKATKKMYMADYELQCKEVLAVGENAYLNEVRSIS